MPSVTAHPPSSSRRSSTSTFRPARARYPAVTSPLCPPPTTITSYFGIGSAFAKHHHSERWQRHRNGVRPIVARDRAAGHHPAVAQVRSAEQLRIGVEDLFVESLLRDAELV